MNRADWQIYPKRYFDESATWYAWNKLTIADVYALREEPGFEGQNIFFYLNHPIHFIRIVGLIVEFNSVANGKYTFLTIDDSSGANIEVKIEKRTLRPEDDAEYPSNTLVDNVDVGVEMGLPTVLLDQKRLELGDVVRAQGILEKFRNDSQLVLKTLHRVKDTNEEAIHWSQAAEWKRDKLSKPWVLTKQQQDMMDEKARIEELEGYERKKKRQKIRAKDEKKQQRREEKLEAKRKEMDAGALKGSEILPAPWL